VLESAKVECTDEQLAEATAPLEAALRSMRSLPPAHVQDREMRRALAALVGSLRDISNELGTIRLIHGELRSGDYSDLAKPAATISHDSPPKDPSKEVESVKLAGKLTAIVSALALGLVYVNPPGGEQALIAALIVAGQPNVGRSLLKWRLRVCGILAGALYGLVGMIIVSKIPFFPVMLILVVLIVFVSSYVASGSERVSYAGLQTGIAASMILVYEPGPPISMDPVVSRFLGAILGGLVAIATSHLLWTVNPAERLRSELAKIVEECRILFRIAVGLDDDVDGAWGRFANLVTARMDQSGQLLRDAGHMVDSSRHSPELFRWILTSVHGILTDLATLRALTRDLPPDHEISEFVTEMHGTALHISSAFDEVESLLGSGEFCHTGADTRNALTELEILVERLRASGRTLCLGESAAADLAIIFETMRDLCAKLNDIGEAIEAIRILDQVNQELGGRQEQA
ncbi:FUSC family protein, partial [Thermodesulfobacteriota bacterium]